MAHRHQAENRKPALEEFRQQQHAAAVKRGQWFALIGLALVVAGATVAAVTGHDLGAGLIAGGGGVGATLLRGRQVGKGD